MMTSTHFSGSAGPVQHWLESGQQALKAGRREDAVAAFRQAVAADPYHVEALMWLAGNCDDPRESLRHIARVLALDPHYEAAHEGIRWARRRLVERETNPIAAPLPQPVRPKPVRPRRPARFERWAQFALALCLCLAVVLSGAIVWALQLPSATANAEQRVLQAVTSAESAPPARDVPASPPPDVGVLSTPSMSPAPALSYTERADKILREVDVVWADQDWERAAPLIAQAAAFRPDDPTLKRKLMAAYFNRAVSLIDDGELALALASFDQALEIAPGDLQVQSERNTLANYIEGLAQFNQRHWATAAQTLAKVYSADAGYLDTRGLLYRAYYFRGLELKEQKDLENALKAFQSAVDLDADAIEARGELVQVKATLVPPPPPAARRGRRQVD